MIFLTIGTLHPFDRLVKTVDLLAGSGRLSEPVVGQIGCGTYQPRHIQAVEVLEKQEFDQHMERASLIISHAGMGSIITAITLQKPMIVMPRLKKYREHVNDHQLDTALKFEELGVVLVANDEDELAEKMAIVPHFKPIKRQAQIETLTARISAFLNGLK
jgi:UDP-N-acetylglucosamine transferase subunit ALG13